MCDSTDQRDSDDVDIVEAIQRLHEVLQEPTAGCNGMKTATAQATHSQWMISARHLRMLTRAIPVLPRDVGLTPFFRRDERVWYTFYLFDWLRNRTDLKGTKWERWQIELLAEELQRHWQYGEMDFPAFVKWLLKRELDR